MMGCTSKAELVRSYLLDNKHTSRIYYSLQFYNLICSFLYYRGGVYRDTILYVTNHLQATRNREVRFSVSENCDGEHDIDEVKSYADLCVLFCKGLWFN